MVMNSFDWHEAGLTVGQVAERSGAAPSALRFYERQGLISADRTAGNQRRYHGDVLCRVAMIRVCQQAGLSLVQTRTALAEAVPDGRIPGPQEWEHLAQHLRREVSSRISELDRLLRALTGQDGDPTQPLSAAPTGRRPALPGGAQRPGHATAGPRGPPASRREPSAVRAARQGPAALTLPARRYGASC
jgi:MerR family redox-sensitive transcriptional activator SoxR